MTRAAATTATASREIRREGRVERDREALRRRSKESLQRRHGEPVERICLYEASSRVANAETLETLSRAGKRRRIVVAVDRLALRGAMFRLFGRCGVRDEEERTEAAVPSDLR